MIGSHHDCPLCRLKMILDTCYGDWGHSNGPTRCILSGGPLSLHVSEPKENPSTISYPPKPCSNPDWIGHLITVGFTYWLLRSNMGFGGTDWWGPIVWESIYVVTIIRTTQLTCAHHLPCTTPKCRWWDLPVSSWPHMFSVRIHHHPQWGWILDFGFLPINSVNVESFCKS